MPAQVATLISTGQLTQPSWPTTVPRSDALSYGDEKRQGVAAIANAVPLVDESKLKSDELGQTVSRLNDYVQSTRRELHFSVDKDNGHMVVKIIDSESEEVIRQIPREDVLAIAERMQEVREGLIIRLNV